MSHTPTVSPTSPAPVRLGPDTLAEDAQDETVRRTLRGTTAGSHGGAITLLSTTNLGGVLLFAIKTMAQAYLVKLVY